MLDYICTEASPADFRHAAEWCTCADCVTLTIAHNAAMWIEADGDDVLVWIKAVPGASRDEVAGTVGDRLKIRISAPPEGGRANKAIIKLLAKQIGIKPAQISIDSGRSNPEKIVRIADCSAEVVHRGVAK